MLPKQNQQRVVWLPETVERKMRGDVIRAASSFNANEKVNEDIIMQQQISLVGDVRLPTSQSSSM